ncbi:MAG: hypothetical protein LBM07_02670 [Culturomica sp.]|jgi:RecJ-like exonuclease|nr:hypothetical protein [Culturomica sp.]
MKDQKRILHKCLIDDVPAFVIAGTDVCAIETMRAYYEIARKNGCSQDFLEDMLLAIQDFEAFKKQEPEKIRLPD